LSGFGGFGGTLRELPRLRRPDRGRAVGCGRTGGDDSVRLAPGETRELARLTGPGVVTQLWCAVAQRGAEPADHDHLRRLVLKVTWDDSPHPSVLVPLGDFFGAGCGGADTAAPLQRAAAGGRGFRCRFAMPFAAGARFELISELSRTPVVVRYCIDYERHESADPELGYFHAQWRRQDPAAVPARGAVEPLLGGGGADYVVLEAEGRGHYVGSVLTVHDLRSTSDWAWCGGGDDAILVDGEPWPPEEGFGAGWSRPYRAPQHGLTLPGGRDWGGQVSYYRFHVADPITFERSIRVTIEHGGARSADVSSVAYWYQALPSHPSGLPPVHDRLPRPRG